MYDESNNEKLVSALGMTAKVVEGLVPSISDECDRIEFSSPGAFLDADDRCPHCPFQRERRSHPAHSSQHAILPWFKRANIQLWI